MKEIENQVSELIDYLNKYYSSGHIYFQWMGDPNNIEVYCDLKTKKCTFSSKKELNYKDECLVSELNNKIASKTLPIDSFFEELKKIVLSKMLLHETLEGRLRDIFPDYDNIYDDFSGFYKSLPKMASEEIAQDKRKSFKIIKNK